MELRSLKLPPSIDDHSARRRIRRLFIGEIVASVVFGIPLFVFFMSMRTAIPRQELRQEDLTVPIETVPLHWKTVIVSKGQAMEWPFPRNEESPELAACVLVLLALCVATAIFLHSKTTKAKAALAKSDRDTERAARDTKETY